LNPNGTLFGGKLLAWIDEEAALYAIIQLGGLFDLNEVQDRFINERKVVLCKSDWTKLLDQIVYEKEKLNQIDYTHTNSYKRILEDLIKGFEIRHAPKS